jgi:hypothetical protein
VFHRVARVHGEVHDHLFELAGVCLDAAQIGLQLEHELDLIADETLQHLVRVRQHAVDVEHFALHHLTPAEGEQLARERRRRLAGAVHLRDVGADGMVLPELFHHQLAVPENAGEQIVEVVRDPAGELADRLHLLRLPELRLGVAQRRYVPYSTAHDVARSVGERADVERDLDR